MNSNDERIVSDLVAELEKAWNAADGARFGGLLPRTPTSSTSAASTFAPVKSSRRVTRRSSIRFTRAASSATRWPEYGRSHRRSSWPTWRPHSRHRLAHLPASTDRCLRSYWYRTKRRGESPHSTTRWSRKCRI